MRIDNLENIKTLIAQTENGQVEFKETTGQLERGMETLCAFLNGESETVLFGVNNKGKIIGQEVADSTDDFKCALQKEIIGKLGTRD